MNYKPWCVLSDSEKGALLLAHHEGKDIEYHSGDNDWLYISKPTFFDGLYYRVKPAVVIRTLAYENYRIKFEIVDGVPDCNSVRMEKI